MSHMASQCNLLVEKHSDDSTVTSVSILAHSLGCVIAHDMLNVSLSPLSPHTTESESLIEFSNRPLIHYWLPHGPLLDCSF